MWLRSAPGAASASPISSSFGPWQPLETHLGLHLAHEGAVDRDAECVLDAQTASRLSFALVETVCRLRFSRSRGPCPERPREYSEGFYERAPSGSNNLSSRMVCS